MTQVYNACGAMEAPFGIMVVTSLRESTMSGVPFHSHGHIWINSRLDAGQYTQDTTSTTDTQPLTTSEESRLPPYASTPLLSSSISARL